MRLNREIMRPLQTNTADETNFKTIVLNIFTDNKEKLEVFLAISKAVTLTLFCLEIHGINILWRLKNPLATKPKELIANWPLKKKD